MSFEIIRLLESGEKRAAYCTPQGQWVADEAVKEQILEVFRKSPLHAFPSGFVDKEALAPQHFQEADHIRLVPGGSSVRAGAYIGKHVIIMPPSYVNIGAYVADSTMIDSHVLVGSCAQIGQRVHLSTAVQIGGVLEPKEACPVIIEDDVFIGAGCCLTSGVVVRREAVLASGVSISSGTKIYDLVHKKELTVHDIPEKAVVVPGTYAASTPWGKERGLSVQCALIIKYKDEKTSAKLALEEALRCF